MLSLSVGLTLRDAETKLWKEGSVGGGLGHRGARAILSIYADSSFFVWLYLPDRHSAETQQRMALKPRVWLTPVHLAEWAHAVSQHVFRKEISIQESRQIQDELEVDRANGLWVEAALPEAAWKTCVDLARKHGPRLGTRTLEGLHVASALEFGAKAFWTFDERQAKLAIAVGLAIP